MESPENNIKEKNSRAIKMMLWLGIASLFMTFAGFTSAFIVSKSREDWITNFDLPQAFTFSLVVIIISKTTLHFSGHPHTLIPSNRAATENYFTTLSLVKAISARLALPFYKSPSHMNSNSVYLPHNHN